MKTPVAHTEIAHGLGECIGLGDLRHGAVEGCVEAGHLGNPRERRRKTPGSAQIGRLVRWLHRHQTLEIIEHIGVDPDRRLVALAAQHDAVAGAHDLGAAEVGLQPGYDELKRSRMIERMAIAPGMRRPRRAVRPGDSEMWIALHAVDFGHGKANWVNRLTWEHRLRISGWSSRR